MPRRSLSISFAQGRSPRATPRARSATSERTRWHSAFATAFDLITVAGVVLNVALYELLAPAHRSLARLAAWCNVLASSLRLVSGYSLRPCRIPQQIGEATSTQLKGDDRFAAVRLPIVGAIRFSDAID
jgi:hypothetical protein